MKNNWDFNQQGIWTPELDKQLIQLVSIYGMDSWADISNQLITQTPYQCNRRWQQMIKPESLKGHWTEEEDEILKTVIGKFGTRQSNLNLNLFQVSKQIPTRSGKQCRERWQNVLNPSIKKGDWVPEEDEKIFQLIKKHGRQWTQISKELPGRTENSIKNRFYSSYRSIIRKNKKHLLPTINQLFDSNKQPKVIEHKIIGMINEHKMTYEQQQKQILQNTISNLQDQISKIQNQIRNIKGSITTEQKPNSAIPATINQYNQFNYLNNYPNNYQNYPNEKAFILIPLTYYQSQEQTNIAKHSDAIVKIEQ